jgi:hypothetical protein
LRDHAANGGDYSLIIPLRAGWRLARFAESRDSFVGDSA